MQTFKKRAADRFNAEVDGLSLSGTYAFIPRLLDAGPNWVVMEYQQGYEKLRPGRSGLLRLDAVRSAFQALRSLHDEGYSWLDFSPHNVLTGTQGDIKLIDFEHLFKYTLFKPEFIRSPALIGAEFFRGEGRIYLQSDETDPKWFSTELPSYERHWRDRVGLPLQHLLEGSKTSQHAHRIREVIFRRGLSIARKFKSRLTAWLPGSL